MVERLLHEKLYIQPKICIDQNCYNNSLISLRRKSNNKLAENKTNYSVYYKGLDKLSNHYNFIINEKNRKNSNKKIVIKNTIKTIAVITNWVIRTEIKRGKRKSWKRSSSFVDKIIDKITVSWVRKIKTVWLIG